MSSLFRQDFPHFFAGCSLNAAIHAPIRAEHSPCLVAAMEVRSSAGVHKIKRLRLFPLSGYMGFARLNRRFFRLRVYCPHLSTFGKPYLLYFLRSVAIALIF